MLSSSASRREAAAAKQAAKSGELANPNKSAGISWKDVAAAATAAATPKSAEVSKAVAAVREAAAVHHEGWMVRYGRRKIGRSFFHTRYFVLESKLLAYYKKKPKDNMVPLKSLLIDGNCRVEDRGLKTHHGQMIYVLCVYNQKEKEHQITMGAHDIEDAMVWKKKIELLIDQGRNPMRYKFPYYTAVKRNFSSICKLLANGYVMTTTIYAGKKLGKLKPGKIYKSPRRGKTRHAITLIGAGRRGQINYYHFLNSWGRYFCLRKQLADPNEGIKVGMRRVPWRKLHRRDKARGGFAMLRAKDIASPPVTFLRHYEDFKLHPKIEIAIRSSKGERLEPVQSSI